MCFKNVQSIFLFWISFISVYCLEESVSLGSSKGIGESKVTHKFEIVGNNFTLDGKLFHLISGSMHYFRSPSQYWRDRLRKLKAAGLNTVSTYVEWSFHEEEEREYNFEGDRDISNFIKIAAEEGLFVILRAGPYICGERDLGGLPYWLRGKYPNVLLRTKNKEIIEEIKIWWEKLFEIVKPLLIANGGPVIMIQIENEYGSYASDKEYLSILRDMMRQHVGNAIIHTTDGCGEGLLKGGSINGTLTTCDFGAGDDAHELYNTLRKFIPEGPLMNSEYYTGWLDKYFACHNIESTDKILANLKRMIEIGFNVNFYMFHGGTNFEFWAGAGPTPYITSYDYNAPLDESGNPTEKYYAIRNYFASIFPEVNKTEPPKPKPLAKYGIYRLKQRLNLLSAKGRKLLGKEYKTYNGEKLPTFEELRQRGGLLLFETVLDRPANDMALLEISKPYDYVYVFMDGVLWGFLNRIHDEKYNVTLAVKPNMTLSLLVDKTGRLTTGDLDDYKGILSPVLLNNKTLNGTWHITGFPLKNLKVNGQSDDTKTRGPVLYETKFILPDSNEPIDTYLDVTGWKTGYIWVNGHNIGRYWPAVKPQLSYYVPGVWLLKAPAKNLLQVLEFQSAPANLSVTFVDQLKFSC